MPRKWKDLSDEVKRRANDQQRKKRASLTPEEREDKLRQRRERRKQKQSEVTEEEAEERRRKRREYDRERKRKEVKDETKKEQQKTRRYFAYQAKLARMTPEEKEKEREKRRQSAMKKTKEEKERISQNRYFRIQAKLAEMTEEERERVSRNRYFRIQAKLAEMTDEEREEWKRKNTERAKKWRENLTEEERERHYENMRRRTKEYRDRVGKKKVVIDKSSERYQRIREYHKKRILNETPEVRQKRLRRGNINRAVRNLKKKLANEGLPQEEIEAKAMELKEKMWAEPLPPPGEVSTSTPRSKLRNGKRKRRTKGKAGDVTTTTKPDLAESTSVEVKSEDFSMDDEDNHGFDDYHNFCQSESRYEEPEETITSEEALLFPPHSSSVTGDLKGKGTSATVITPPNSIKCPHCTSHFPQRSDLTAHISSEHREVQRRKPRKRVNSAPRKKKEVKEKLQKVRRNVEETPEEREKRLEKKRQVEKLRIAKMTPEEKEDRLRKNKESCYFARQAKFASMTPEEKEEYDKMQREKCRKFRMNMTKEQKEWHQRRKYFRKHARLAEMTREEREAWTKRNTEMAKKWRHNLPEEKRRRYLQYIHDYQKKHGYGAYAPKSSKRYEKLLEWQRGRIARETPQERQRRLRRYKVYQAVRKLKKELENEGVPQEEIEEKAKELKERMWAEPLPPPERISSYTSRPRKSKSKQRADAVEEEGTLDPKTGGENSDNSLMETLTYASDMHEDDDNSFDCHGHDYSDQYEDASDPVASVSPPAEKMKASLEVISNLAVITSSAESSEEAHLSRTPLPPSPSSPLIDLNAPTTPFTSIATATVTVALDSVMKCPHCTSSFPLRSDLTAHISSEHPRKCWTCPICNQIMLTSLEMKEHFKTEHTTQKDTDTPEMTSTSSTPPQSQSFSCIKCDPLTSNSNDGFQSVIDLNEHVKSKHPESYWPCSKCNLLKYSENSLKVHETVCGNKLLSRKKKRVKLVGFS